MLKPSGRITPAQGQTLHPQMKARNYALIRLIASCVLLYAYLSTPIISLLLLV